MGGLVAAKAVQEAVAAMASVAAMAAVGVTTMPTEALATVVEAFVAAGTGGTERVGKAVSKATATAAAVERAMPAWHK